MNLELSLSQKQSLSQRMQLSVKLLQMNAMDIDQFLLEASLENPLIELELPQEDDSSELTRLRKLEWLDSMDESNSYQYQRGNPPEELDMPLYKKTTTDSLTEVLTAQLPGFRLPPETESIVLYLIGNLDENGYIEPFREHLLADLGISETALDEAISVLHRMDPPGVGATDLRECLLIQAQRMPQPSTVLISLIENHLDLLAKNQLAKIARAMHVLIDEVKDARDLLLTLNPKPGNGYSSYKAIPYIRPDLFVIRFEDRYQVILNDYSQPKIHINSYYSALAENDSPETAAYISDKLNKAQWLSACIQQRKNTIMKCASSILQRQIRFFEAGPGHLAPMTLADVAGDLAMHPSTISRAVRGKYLQCQWGIFAFADFFSRIVSEAAEGQSQDMIMSQIKRIIAEENPAKPFSDQAIADRLRKNDTHIARRTVAKYRDQLGIPPASRRRQY